MPRLTCPVPGRSQNKAVPWLNALAQAMLTPAVTSAGTTKFLEDVRIEEPIGRAATGKCNGDVARADIDQAVIEYSVTDRVKGFGNCCERQPTLEGEDSRGGAPAEPPVVFKEWQIVGVS